MRENAGGFGIPQLARKVPAFSVMGLSFRSPLWPYFLLPLQKKKKKKKERKEKKEDDKG